MRMLRGMRNVNYLFDCYVTVTRFFKNLKRCLFEPNMPCG